MIIGIAGTLGAGKGTVVEYLQKVKGFGHFSVSGLLKEILVERGLPAVRENLSRLADELNEQHEGGVLYLSHKRAEEAGEDNYILESIHRTSEAAYVRSLGGLILGVDADPKTRYERTTVRNEGEKDNVTFEQFLESIEREEEGKGEGTPHIRQVLNEADFVIKNNGTLEELHQQIDEVLKQIEDDR